ncbi:unnamed protein product [Darwinula stevensoni]|uniref:adenine phosphoribosyltransferase n=1 Tax=Darwinula stevensoni TaxID=69355 RepID=A0A7R9A441_9CRUS|nr:unnamed protein product [Darwinula stevensoni]CAG0891801.1 unnamed protein product [Darwinula stevensoni]
MTRADSGIQAWPFSDLRLFTPGSGTDIFSLFLDPSCISDLLGILSARVASHPGRVDGVVGVESRGFLLGPMLAHSLRLPFVPVRKKGKLPGRVLAKEYELEYGHNTLEIQVESLSSERTA